MPSGSGDRGGATPIPHSSGQTAKCTHRGARRAGGPQQDSFSGALTGRLHSEAEPWGAWQPMGGVQVPHAAPTSHVTWASHSASVPPAPDPEKGARRGHTWRRAGRREGETCLVHGGVQPAGATGVLLSEARMAACASNWPCSQHHQPQAQVEEDLQGTRCMTCATPSPRRHPQTGHCVDT